MPTTDDIWGEALQEAYASAPTSEVILHTLEFRHPVFGNSPIRLVRDHGEEVTIGGETFYGFYLTLEDDAPIQASQSVFFQGCMFNFDLPEQKEGSLPTITVELDNVTRTITSYMDQAIGHRAVMEMTYREYLLSDRTAPQFILGGFSLREVTSTVNRVTGTAQFGDLLNRNFPGKIYRPDEFRGLLQ